MDSSISRQLTPGARVLVTQQIARRGDAWTNQITGEVVGFEQKETGSWYAHSKNDKLWLDRLMLKLADGEIVTLNLDNGSRIEILPAAPQPAGTAQ